MPKTRGSNNIASIGRGNNSGAAGGGLGYAASSGGDGAYNEITADSTSNESGSGQLGQRVEDRLRDVRITVNVPSRTRGRDEEVEVNFQEPGIARVSSASGNTYTVNYHNGECDCMHYRIHENGCRHIDAANTALGQALQQRDNDGSMSSDTNEMIGRQAELDEEAETERRNLSLEQEDDGFFYEDNKALFKSMMRGEMNEAQYEYNNVLNGSKITFGVELEFVGGNADAIARELYNLGICAFPERVHYHHESVAGKWRLERDGSVSDGGAGGEIVSPVMRDCPETWQQIEKICEVAKRHGARVNSQTGAHVHVGMEPLDTARQRWRRFFGIVGRYEECIYRVAGGDLGRIRQGYDHYAMPFQQKAKDVAQRRFRMDTIDDVNRLAESVASTRYYGINLTNIPRSNAPNTVEFRYFNGSLNPKQIQANIKLANGVVIAAEKARTKESENFEITSNMKRRGMLLKDSVENVRKRDENSVRKFLDIIFTRKKDKDALIEVFSKNVWK